MDDIAVRNFQTYLQIKSVQPDVDYEPCVEFLTAQAAELDLSIRVYRLYPKHPVVVLTWLGKNPELPSILLNSHMDVVPVFPERWAHDPFGGEIDEEENIYGRGAQDMKCVGIQYLESVRRLKREKFQPIRTVHISFVPDEEIGSEKGMCAFAEAPEFKELNVGCGMDEGVPSDSDTFNLFYGERCMWQLLFRCTGQSGHGSLLLDNTPGEKINHILTRMFEFREEEKKKLRDDPSLTIGNVTTVNLTLLKGGVQGNVIPPEMVAVADCRIPITVDFEDFEKTLSGWCKEAGDDVSLEFVIKEEQVPCTKLDNTNPYWMAFKKVADEMKMVLHPLICCGATDARFIRGRGIPAFGFSPINNTVITLHDHDEFLNKKVFLRGIEIYCKLIPAIASA